MKFFYISALIGLVSGLVIESPHEDLEVRAATGCTTASCLDYINTLMPRLAREDAELCTQYPSYYIRYDKSTGNTIGCCQDASVIQKGCQAYVCQEVYGVRDKSTNCPTGPCANPNYNCRGRNSLCCQTSSAKRCGTATKDGITYAKCV
ncbi:hypothetical protein B0I35DRAFT_413817 [Stachybotrys elegans]|uniref:Uncharacterized protein n=1 Tax=Stachybotrys elegans TaxID=80388 RepID=A0A8K0SGZ7_9HYPO|nr:hypothetical protein B0I35DRAFT_413817 [Stachybotrys elegans]